MSKDLFSQQSAIYAKYRPGYPPALVEYILQFVPGRDTVWDCATGNGQAAVELAHHFRLVEATDISEAQLLNAVKLPAIRYSVSSAEQTTFPNKTFDLITVAQAYHWLDFSAFESEVKRVLRPSGVVAVWGYSLARCEDKEIDEQLQDFYKNTVGPYWDAERKFIDNHYRDIPFPYNELPSKEFFIEQHWTLQDLSGYLNTWSSVQHFIKGRGFNPVNEFMQRLHRSLPGELYFTFTFPLFLRMGRI